MNTDTDNKYSNNKNNDIEKKVEIINDENSDNNKQKNMIEYISSGNHPIVCFVLISFKLATLVCFLVLYYLTQSTAMVYLVIILLASIDFWTTKNVAGRLLVGLRWWNEVKEDGNEVWIFESKNENKEVNADSRVFWTCLYLFTGVWIIIFVWDIVVLKWVWAVVSLICFIFNAINFYGFFKCSKKQQENLKSFGAKATIKIFKKGTEYANKNNNDDAK